MFKWMDFTEKHVAECALEYIILQLPEALYLSQIEPLFSSL